jgi:3-phosphoshikimate 1-carboxyvinyltransferase
MGRVAEPLGRMGARMETTGGAAPVRVHGGALVPIDYRLPVASAQVKSAVLLAALSAPGRTTVVEPEPTRDHTELLLERAGARVVRRPGSVSLDGPAERLRLADVEVPGDFSAAAPFLVAAALLAGSQLTVHGVGLNPRRTGLLDALEHMGARVAVFNRSRLGPEPAGDVEIRAAPLVATTVDAGQVPRLVDELPLLALAATHARGETVFRGIAELRVKETDRLDGTATALRALGARVTVKADELRVTGVPARPRGGGIDSRGDHRIAMLGAVAGLASRDGVVLEGPEAVAASFPGFFDVLDSVVDR